MSDMPPDLIAVRDAACLLRVADKTVRRWIEAGKLPAYVRGGWRVLVSRGDVEALTVRKAVTPRPDVPTRRGRAARASHAETVLAAAGFKDYQRGA